MSLRTPSEQEDKELMVKPSGLYSGLSAINASFSSCFARVESRIRKVVIIVLMDALASSYQAWPGPDPGLAMFEMQQWIILLSPWLVEEQREA